MSLVHNVALPLRLRQLGLQEYLPVWQAMRAAVNTQSLACAELWCVEHPAVFTQGQSGKAEHVLSPGAIPVIQSDRGGQVTFHGPGQAVIYLLLDLQSLGLGIRSLVEQIESTVLSLLARHGLSGVRRPQAPGIYLQGSKIASIGLRVKQGRTYHGLSINTAMDLEPFQRINPCGYAGLTVTDLASHGIAVTVAQIQRQFATEFAAVMGYTLQQPDLNELPHD